MRFFLSRGEYFKEKLRFLPYGKEFMSSRLLVVGTDSADRIVGVCGIRSLFNILVLYVKERYRNRGVGTQLLIKTMQAVEKQRLGFVTLSVSSENKIAFRLYRKLGFRQVLSMKKSGQILMVTSTTRMGRLACGFFRMIGLLLPDNLLSYVHLWLYAKTL